MNLKKRLQQIALQLSHLPLALQMTWTASRHWTMAWAVLLTLQGILPAASVYLTKPLVDSLVTALRAGGTSEGIQPALFYALLMAVVMLTTQLVQNILGWVRLAQGELVTDYIHGLIHQKAVTVDFAFYESPEYFDRLYRVRNEASSRPLALMEDIGNLAKNSITFLAMAAILLPYGAWLPVVLLISTLPAFWVTLYFNRKHHAWWEACTEDRRRTEYFDSVLTHSSSAAEIRLFDLGAVFMPAFMAIRTQLRGERLALEKQQMWARIGSSVLALIMTGAVLVWMGWRALRGLASLGDLALFYQAFNQGQNLMRGLLGSVNQVYRNTLFLGNLFEFLNLEPTVVSTPHPVPAPTAVRNGIRFNRVTFYYPGSEKPALQDVSLTIQPGQTIAFVGENGAGKSTLLKLLTRLYDPQSGSIEIDGIDIKDLSIDQLWRMITVLFQFPIRFFATASENITLGDMQAKENLERIHQSAQAAGIHKTILNLPDEYQTKLGKWFTNGKELSGGEWQRLAMARAFFREAPIIALDEPTSQMDSWSEVQWYDRFRTLAEGRIGVIITHRFTIAKRADVIYVMQNGTIVESGSHEALLEEDGLYKQSWTEQIQDSTMHDAL